MRSSSSRSKTLSGREPLVVGPPDIPILETGDLPAPDDWALMESLRLDQNRLCDIDPDSDQVTQSMIENELA
jgi:hypothetical protein